MPRLPNTSPQTRALLSALASSPGEWRHGFALAKELGLRSGTLYPLLIRLADQGFLEAAWEPPKTSGVPPRHVYRLTFAGMELAKQPVLEKRTTTLRDRRIAPA